MTVFKFFMFNQISNVLPIFAVLATLPVIAGSEGDECASKELLSDRNRTR